MALTKVSSSLVSDSAVTSGKIADGGVATADIATNAVTSTKIAQNSILTKHIDDGQVTTAQLGADAVTAAKIADDAISEEHLDVTVITSLTAVTAATGDLLMVADVSDSNNLKKIPVSSILAGTHTGSVNTSGTISSGAIISSGNLHAGDGTDINMDSSGNGQLEVDGDGYTGAIALNGSAMHIYHNSSSRNLVLGTNETARLTIGGGGTFNFESNDLTSIGTISSKNIVVLADGTSSTNIQIGQNSSSNHYAYIDLVGDSTYPDYGLRLLRGNAGANSVSTIYHRGTGDFIIEAQEAAPIILRTGGATALTLDTSGNVGIGVSSNLLAKLHIGGAPIGNAGALVFLRNTSAAIDNTSFGGVHFSSSPGTDYSIGKANVNGVTSLSFRNGNSGASLMELSSAGNLGIGVTPKTDWDTGYKAIQIGESSAFFANASADEVFMSQNARWTSGGWKYNSSGTATLFDMQSGTTRWRRATSGSNDGTISWAESMRIDTSGNVGIGTPAVTSPGLWYDANPGYLAISHWATPPTPAAMLHLSDNSNDLDVPQIRIEGRENPGDTKLDISVKDPGVRFNLIEGPSSDASGGFGLMEFKTNAAVNVGYPTRGGFKFITEAHSNNLVITNTGDIGINIATPRSKLSINSQGAPATSTGNMANTGLTIHNGTGGTAVQLGTYDAGSWGYIQSGYVNNATVAREFRIMNGANYTLTLSNTGKVGIGTTSPTLDLDVSGPSSSMVLPGTSGTTPKGFLRLGYNDRSWGGGEILMGVINDSNTGYAGYLQVKAPTDYSVNRNFTINPLGGNLLVGKTVTGTTIAGLFVSPNDFMSYTNTSTDTGDRLLLLNQQNRSSGHLIEFRTQGSNVGIISLNTSGNIVYGGQSDYRLKENVNYTWSATAKLKQLKPCEFEWKSDNYDAVNQGFLAHEVASVVPQAVIGNKDGVDKDDNPSYQQLDNSALVPLLTKAIQEQQTLIESLTARIETLEG